MALQIEWTPQALQDFYAVILYLQENWNSEIADTFIANTEERLLILAEKPLLGITAVRSIVPTRYNRLYYSIDTSKLVVLNI